MHFSCVLNINIIIIDAPSLSWHQFNTFLPYHSPINMRNYNNRLSLRGLTHLLKKNWMKTWHKVKFTHLIWDVSIAHVCFLIEYPPPNYRTPIPYLCKGRPYANTSRTRQKYINLVHTSSTYIPLILSLRQGTAKDTSSLERNNNKKIIRSRTGYKKRTEYRILYHS